MTQAPRNDQENLLCLPRTLPPNVYYFVTQRPPDSRRGITYLHPRILEDTPRKVFDLRTEWSRRDVKGIKSKTRLAIEATINGYIDTFLDGKVVDRVSKKVLASGLKKHLEAAAAKNSDFSVSKFREKFVDVSEGNFLYIVYVLADMAKGLFPVDLDEQTVKQLPDGIDGYYRRQIARLESKLTPGQWEVIYVTAYFARPNSKYWPTVRYIANAANQEMSMVRTLLLECGYYLEEKQNPDIAEEGYWVYHLSFRDYLDEVLDVEKLTGKTKRQIKQQIIDSLDA